MNPTAQQGALAGIKVLDLSRVLAGPSCTQILADLGAEVIKVEHPNGGDETRQWSPPAFADGTAAYFATANRNKQSLTLNIASAEGQQIIRQLAEQADVLVENYKVGGLKKYGLDYDSLSAINPRLVYASLTGFGQNGPDADKPGYDYIIQGLSGLMSITGAADGMPHKVGVAVVDLFAGLQLTVGIQAALLARARTGRGQHLDVSLLDSAVAMLANVGMNHLATDTVPPRLGNAHPNIVPYQVFETQGGQHLILACGNDRQFAAVCRVMGENWHEDARFASNPQRVANRDVLVPEMAAVFLRQPRDAWLAKLEAAQVPCGAIHNIAEALQMPQVQHRGMVVELDNMRLLGNPIHFSDTPVSYRSAPPKLGEHSVAILQELGWDAATIQDWQNRGVI